MAVNAPAWTTLATFLSHAILLTLMAAASLIDFDEKTIPDGVTTPGTLLALALAAALPMSLLLWSAIRFPIQWTATGTAAVYLKKDFASEA